MEAYGVFVELTPNLAGLAEYRADVAVGQTVAVYIKNIIPERMKIKLVIIDSTRSLASKTPKFELLTDGLSHISSWHYSPENCTRVVETVFAEQ